MEQIIPILIAAVVFGFQAYQNYQKEQEKARKRNPGQRPQQQEGEEQGRGAEDRQPQQQVLRERQSTIQPPIPVPEAAPLSDDYQEYAGFIDEVHVAQLTKKRNTKGQDDLLKPLQVTGDDDDDGDVESEMGENTFDLRKAVINASILERPYQ